MRPAILVSVLLFWTAPLHAATVAIVRPPSPSPELIETLSRLHGELLSVGLEVEITEGPAARGLGTIDSRAWLEKLAAERGIDAIIDASIDSADDAAPVAVDVWLVHKKPRSRDVALEVSRVTLEPNTEQPSEKLAIRAIEVLRSSFLESDLVARERRGEAIAKTPAASLTFAEVNKPVARPERLGIAVGAAALTSLDGIGPAILPILRIDWAASSWIVVQTTLAGLGSSPTVATTAGSARVTQHYGVVGGCFRFRSDPGLRPFVAMSAGVMRTSVEGQANAPYRGHAVGQWSLLFDGSVGTALRLGGRYYAALAAHVQVAAPYVALHLTNEVVATSGRPNLLLTLTLGAWL